MLVEDTLGQFNLPQIPFQVYNWARNHDIDEFQSRVSRWRRELGGKLFESVVERIADVLVTESVTVGDP